MKKIHVETGKRSKKVALSVWQNGTGKGKEEGGVRLGPARPSKKE